MIRDDIKVEQLGLVIFGTAVGVIPEIATFEAALEGETIRRTGVNQDAREVRICDSKGLSWLVDIEHGTVLWFDSAPRGAVPVTMGVVGDFSLADSARIAFGHGCD